MSYIKWLSGGCGKEEDKRQSVSTDIAYKYAERCLGDSMGWLASRSESERWLAAGPAV